MIVRRTTNCARCGEAFEWIENTDLADWPRTYCSKSCRMQVNRERRTTDLANAVGTDIRLLSCVRCGIPFAWSRPNVDDADPPHYHSTTCQRAGRKARQKSQVRAGQSAPTVETARIVAQADAARELLLPAGKCTTCGKVANPTEQAAKEAKAAIERRSGHRNAVRYYQCPDGWWHWTSREATKDAYRRRVA